MSNSTNTNTQSKKILIAYHGHCLDGFTAAWVARKELIESCGYTPEEIDTLEMVYGKLVELEQRAEDYDTVYILDFSIPVPLLTQIAEVAEVYVMDHHKTAMEMYAQEDLLYWQGFIGKAHVTIDMTECGASLTYQSMVTTIGELPVLLKYVKDHDLWEHEYIDTPSVNKYLRTLPKSFARWNILETQLEDSKLENNIIISGEGMQAYHDMIVSHLVAEATEVTIGGITGLAVNCSPQFTNEVGHLLGKQSGTYGATWQQVGSEVKWSLRSDRNTEGTTDVSALCKKFGGGGHENAAGFTLSPPVQGKIFSDEEDFQEVGVSIWSVE